MRTWPPDCRTKPNTWLRPSPVPLPTGLVVKNGSNALAITSGVIPEPVSETASITYCPLSISASAACWASISTLLVSISSRPPSGIASRALTARLRMTFSS